MLTLLYVLFKCSPTEGLRNREHDPHFMDKETGPEMEYLTPGHSGFEPRHLGSRVHRLNPQAVWSGDWQPNPACISLKGGLSWRQGFESLVD